MTAELTGIRDFIEAFKVTPRDLHPYGAIAIHWLFCDMRAAVDDPAEVMRLAVRRRVVQELRWEAESAHTAKCFRDAYRLRRQAERFEASYGRG